MRIGEVRIVRIYLRKTRKVSINNVEAEGNGRRLALLGGLGIYGVMSYSVSQRTREFGIRIALGADLAQILRSVIVRGLRLTLIGVLLGVAGGLFLTRFLQSLLFGKDSHHGGRYGSFGGCALGHFLPR